MMGNFGWKETIMILIQCFYLNIADFIKKLNKHILDVYHRQGYHK